MKTPFDFDKTAQDVFSSEGAPAARDPLRLLCVSTPGVNSGFDPRRMPSLALACPAQDGAEQRYRGPLWRPFRASAT